MFPSIVIFGKEIGTYGIMVVIGGFFCALVGRFLVRRFGMDLFDLLILMLSISVGIFIGAHIVFSLTNIQTLILTFQHIGELWFDRFWELFTMSIGGMVFYGGFLGGLASIPIYCKFDKRVKSGHLFDLLPCWCRCSMYSAGSAAFSAAAATALSRRLASPFTATS